MIRIALSSGVLLASVTTTSAETITVCADGCDYTSINAAIAVASDGDVIQIGNGIYEPFSGQGKNLTLVGNEKTIVQGNTPAPGSCSYSFSGGGIGEVGNVTFETIQFKWLHRGGIKASNSQVIFRNCSFIQCTSQGSEAACVEAESCIFEHSRFIENTAAAQNSSPNQLFGGLVTGYAEFSYCEFQSNCGMITSESATLSGCIICSHQGSFAANCIFGRSNSLELFGCAVLNSQTEVFIEDRNRPYTATGCYFACNRPDDGASYFFGDKATLIQTSICNEACVDADCDDHWISTGKCDPDCNDNGFIDVVELISGQASDYDENWVPDACECLADLNTDGTVGAADLGLLIAAWGDAEVLPQADINRDGNNDAIDLGLLLGAWGPCN